MKPNEIDNVSIEKPGRHLSDDEHNDLKSDRVGAEERPARPLGTRPEEGDVGEVFECVCSNCGHVIPKVVDVPCPPCPVCAGHMEVA